MEEAGGRGEGKGGGLRWRREEAGGREEEKEKLSMGKGGEKAADGGKEKEK